MSTAYEIRQSLLDRAEDIVSTYISVALGEAEFEGDRQMLKQAFQAVTPLMRLKDDPLNIPLELSKTDKIDYILDKMYGGTLTSEHAESLIKAVQEGTDVVGLEELIAELRGLTHEASQ